MVREAGGDAPPPPEELRVTEALDQASVTHAVSLVGDAFGVPADAQPFMAPAFNSDTSRVWLGTVDGVPVATAAAVVSGGFCGVYAVATAADARGRGYGAALTWAATRFRSDLPAVLQASDLGRPVYERLGTRRSSCASAGAVSVVADGPGIRRRQAPLARNGTPEYCWRARGPCPESLGTGRSGFRHG